MWAYLKFRLQRRFRRWRRELRQLRAWWHDYFNRHVWGKWHQLGIIRRLVLVWCGTMALLTFGLWGQVRSLEDYYLVKQPLPGGHYVEGEVGKLKLINPILPESSVSSDVTRLIFNGLTRNTPDRGIEGDLATSWTVSPDGKTYSFNLRHDVHWHDGVPFSARDVAFTITAIQNPDTRSPLAASWLGVKTEVKSDYSINFILPNPYSPFIYSTTVGILPAHLLESSDPASLRIAPFNQQPVGTGPFKLTTFAAAQGDVELEANPNYYGGKPKLSTFSFRLYDSYAAVLDAYAKRQVTAIARYLPNDPASRRQLAQLKLNRLSLPDQTDVFLRTASPLLTDKPVRQALALATDRAAIIKSALGGNARVLAAPILPGQLGYTASLRQTGPDLATANSLLDQAGWTLASGVRTKDGKPLELKLVTGDSGELPRVAELLRDQWAKVGVKLDITTTDGANLQQTYIRPRNYDVLLFGINIGSDPDVYVYWHSSQANDPGLNLSQYSSPAADKALEVGRISNDPDVRAGKYQAFMKVWSDDTPAVVLYSPDYVYAVNSSVAGIKAQKLVDPSDRFYDVENWTVLTRLVPRT